MLPNVDLPFEEQPELCEINSFFHLVLAAVETSVRLACYAVALSFRSLTSRMYVICTFDDRPIPVPGEPRRAKVEAFNSTAIHVQWHPPNDREHNGVIRGYHIHYGPADSVAADALDIIIPGVQDPSVAGVYDTMNGTATEAVLVGLQPETEYSIRVSAYTRRGDGLRTRPKKVRTKGAGACIRVVVAHAQTLSVDSFTCGRRLNRIKVSSFRSFFSGGQPTPTH